MIIDVKIKPLNGKNYGSICHLPESRMGPSDHHCHEGQSRICTIKTRDKNDIIIVQEKLDGSNVGVCRVDDEILAISRAGYLCWDSSYEQHRRFALWVNVNKYRFMSILNNGERLCGEWLAQAHSTRYKLAHEPFVAFDLIKNRMDRITFDEFNDRLKGLFVTPKLLHVGGSISIESSMKLLGKYGHHGAIDEVEGIVYRVERNGKVDFLAKYVRPDKQDGVYLHGEQDIVWND